MNQETRDAIAIALSHDEPEQVLSLIGALIAHFRFSPTDIMYAAAVGIAAYIELDDNGEFVVGKAKK